ncbi:ricin-type beta-trefoil lectin domain protein [Streptomyces sp. NPDC102441]|uniref:ricin-type beta-trefoil lectin domain protein n=1 Tax=Streptomyces sp. NPDC102441 TaxID=3366176 RepID=UPI003811F64D
MISLRTRSTGAPRGRRKRTAMVLAAASAGAVVATMLTGGSASADSGGSLALPLSAPGRYLRLCLDVLGASPANYTPVQVHECNGTSAQKWNEITLNRTVRALGKCLDVQGGGTANGTKVDLYQCNGTAAQLWLPWGGQDALYNPQSGKCLDDPNASVKPVQVQIWDCNGGVGQQWERIAG